MNDSYAYIAGFVVSVVLGFIFYIAVNQPWIFFVIIIVSSIVIKLIKSVR